MATIVYHYGTAIELPSKRDDLYTMAWVARICPMISLKVHCAWLGLLLPGSRYSRGAISAASTEAASLHRSQAHVGI